MFWTSHGDKTQSASAKHMTAEQMPRVNVSGTSLPQHCLDQPALVPVLIPHSSTEPPQGVLLGALATRASSVPLASYEERERGLPCINPSSMAPYKRISHAIMDLGVRTKLRSHIHL